MMDLLQNMIYKKNQIKIQCFKKKNKTKIQISIKSFKIQIKMKQ